MGQVNYEKKCAWNCKTELTHDTHFSCCAVGAHEARCMQHRFNDHLTADAHGDNPIAAEF